MVVVNNCTVLIKNIENEAYSIGAVTNNPRGASAVDIKAGLDNLHIEEQKIVGAKVESPKIDLPLAVIRYLFHDYFASAHRSGLYNRQIRLWEMFSRVTSAEVKQLERGFFSRTFIPVYEIVFKTAQGQNPVCALVITKELTTTDGFKNQSDKGKVYVELLREFLLKVVKIQARLGANGVKGIFVVTPEPLEPTLMAFIDKNIKANDPVARAESIMPAPVSAHINLLTYAYDQDADGEDSNFRINLVHPNIGRK